MSAVSLESLRSPLAAETPSGVNLEYDPRFVEMQRMAAGTREQQYGKTIIAATPPDWRGIGQLAEELAGETRDLRLAVSLVESRTHAAGLDGLADGLELLRCWTCDFWDSVHPQLEESDGHDPFVRINSLARLCETDRLPALISAIPLAEAPPHLSVTLEDMRRAGADSGAAGNSERPTLMEIEAAFLSLSLAELRQRYEMAQRAEQALAEMLEFLEHTAGAGVWNAQVLVDRIGRCAEVLKDTLRTRLSVSDAAVADVTQVPALNRDANSTTLRDGLQTRWQPASMTAAAAGSQSHPWVQIESRRDAEHVLDAVVRYFETHEPSSPIPLLLRRAKRMINQGFVDILRDLAPDALVQAQNLAGEPDA